MAGEPLLNRDEWFCPHEEGEPESILEPTDLAHVEFLRQIADEHGFPLSDWKPVKE